MNCEFCNYPESKCICFGASDLVEAEDEEIIQSIFGKRARL